MTRLIGTSLALVGLGVVCLDAPIGATTAPSPAPVAGTPLPSGWELCILQGVGASVTDDDVADLDEWQVAEGGSTNNAAAYNPFNTHQVTDSSGTPLPAHATSNGPPAFTTWAAGCAATVATLLTPAMAPIVTALQAGDVTPPGIFLADVDETPWCAPSVAGIPCYANEVLAGELVGTLLNGSTGPINDALTAYSATSSDLSAFVEAASVTAADQAVVATKTQQLAVAETEVSATQRTFAAANLALRRLAINDYTTGRMLSDAATFQLSGPPDEQGMISRYFRGIAVNLLVGQFDEAEAAAKTALALRATATAAVAQATTVLDAASAAQTQDLSQLEGDVKSIETARSCPAPPVVTPTASPAVGGGSPSQLWQQLQGCLAPTPTPPAQVSATAPLPS
jgi:hypothetical protein